MLAVDKKHVMSQLAPYCAYNTEPVCVCVVPKGGGGEWEGDRWIGGGREKDNEGRGVG